MKYLITFSLSAALLGTAVVLSGHPLDGCAVIAILVASCLPAGMIGEYRNEPRSAVVPRLAPSPRPVVRIKLSRKPFRAPALEPRLPASPHLVSSALER